MSEHPVRNCLGCGQVDDHPRHRVRLPRDQYVEWHMDCHSRSPDGCETCEATVAAAEERQGHELRMFIQDNAPAAHLTDQEEA